MDTVVDVDGWFTNSNGDLTKESEKRKWNEDWMYHDGGQNQENNRV